MSFVFSKIMIFGRPGSGKSTFALSLHKATKIPLHHLDKHFYKSNWVEQDYQEFLKIQQAIINTDSWIIDGNNTKSLESRYQRADLVIYFNYPRWLCYWRTLKRFFKKNSEIDDRADGCAENIRFSLLRYMWSFESRVAHQITLLKEKYPYTRFVEISSDKDLKMLVTELIEDNR